MIAYTQILWQMSSDSRYEYTVVFIISKRGNTFGNSGEFEPVLGGGRAAEQPRPPGHGSGLTSQELHRNSGPGSGSRMRRPVPGSICIS